MLSLTTALWGPLILTLAGLLVYSNSLAGPFMFDDLALEADETIRDLGDWLAVLSPPVEAPTAGRPLVNLSFAVNYAIGGSDVFGYHAVNVAVHLCCAWLLFGIVRRTLASPRLRESFGAQSTVLAFVVALFWLLHPLNTEVVDYLSQRTESLMALCYLLTLYSSIRDSESPNARWKAVALLACAAGMASKESMVTAPVAIILYDISFRFASIRDAMQLRKAFYLALASAWALLTALIWSGPRALSAGFSTSVTWWTYLLNQAVMLVRYLELTLWPRHLVLNYGWPVPLTLREVAPQVLLIGALVALTIVAWTRRRLLGFLGVWFFMTLAPTTLVPIATEVGAERRMYLPVIAPVALVVLGLFEACRRVRVREGRVGWRQPDAVIGVLAALATSIALGSGVIARNREYRSALAMSQTVLERWPSAVADTMAGVAEGEAGRHQAAVGHFQDAIAKGYVPARYSLAVELFAAGRIDDAVDHLQFFLSQPRESAYGLTIPARTLLAQAYMQQEKWPQAIAEGQAILAEHPSDLEARRLLADASFRQRDFDRSIAEYSAYLAGRPNDPDAVENLGLALALTGKSNEAAAAFSRLLVLVPTHSDARRNLVLALLEGGNLRNAEEQARRALSLRPDDASMLELLGRTLVGQNKLEEAARAFEQALRIDPGYSPAREQLSRLRTPPADSRD